MSSVVVVGTQWGDEGKGRLQIFFPKMQKRLLDIKVGTMQVIQLSLMA